MKRYIRTAPVIFFAALALVGCSKAEDVQGNPDSALQIESVSGISPFALMQEPSTKAVIIGNTLTGSDAATGIGIFVTASSGGAYDGHANGYTNVKFSNSGSGWSTATPVYLSDTEGKLHGYFPYNADATDLRAIPVASSLGGTDYLYADSKTVSHTNKSVSLTMNHALSRLHLTIRKGANFTASAPLSKITLTSTAIDATGTMDLATGAVTASKKSNETGTVELTTDGEITADGIEKDILLVPANNSEGKKSISISLMIAGNPAGITIPAENGLDIRSGIQNNVTLTVEDTGIKVEGIGVGTWGEGDSQTVQVSEHTVTVKFSEDTGIADDVWTKVRIDGSSVIIKAYSKAGRHLKCNLAGDEYCPQSKTSDLTYSFTLSDIASDITATIGYAKLFTINVSSVNTDWGDASASMIGEVYEGEKVNFLATVKGACKFIEWQDSDGNKLDWKYSHDVSLASNFNVKAIFEAPDGSFSVSNDGGKTTKQILFSKGNLYYDGNNFNFETNQYDFRSHASYPSNISGGSETIETTPNGHWGLFCWVGSQSEKNGYPEKYGVTIDRYDFGFNSDPLKSDWGTTIDNQGTWRTLSHKEWEYLFEGRTVAATKTGYAQVCGVYGILLLPDVFNDPKTNESKSQDCVEKKFVPIASTGWDQNVYSGENWNRMQTAGAVFLPAAGYRDSPNSGLKVTDQCGSGWYWSSSANTADNSYHVYFNNNSVSPISSDTRSTGCAVRLITEVKQ